MRRIPALAATAATTVLLPFAGCHAPEGDVPRAARADLQPTRGSEVHGTVRFEPASGRGLRVRAELSGLPPGEHAYHVHLYGDCSAPDASSAGTHFNFIGASKNPPEDIDRITGNLGELVADASGEAVDESRVELAHLAGPAAILGRAVVVHARGNDPDSPPIGDAGPRLACGVIGIDEPRS